LGSEVSPSHPTPKGVCSGTPGVWEFRVEDSGFGVKGLGGLGFGVWDLGVGVSYAADPGLLVVHTSFSLSHRRVLGMGLL